MCRFPAISEEIDGGDERNRTADPLLARQVLSQLSYTPTGLQGFRYASVFFEVLIQTLKIKQRNFNYQKILTLGRYNKQLGLLKSP